MKFVVAILLLALAGAAHGAQPAEWRGSFLQVDAEPLGDNPLQKVPIVGEKFKVNPVSTSMQCIISLTLQYVIVYTALAIVRCVSDVLGWQYGKTTVNDVLESVCNTVAFAPMLAVLFLGCRMRVAWLTQGKDNPPEYVQVAMYCCTYSVLLMTLVVCVIPIFTGKFITADKKTGELEDTNPFTNEIMKVLFTVLKYLILLGLYVGSLVVVYGIITFEPPKGIWPGDKTPPVSPAVQCVMILSCQFFLVYGGVQAAKTWSQFTKQDLSTIDGAFQTATLSMNFAPMLAILFIAARMRALQMDPVNGAPQSWAQNCFFMCTYALLVQTCLTLAVPIVLGGTAKIAEGENAVEGEVVYTGIDSYTAIAAALSVGKYIILVCTYVGFACVIYSILVLEHPAGPEYTPPISVTMQCVMNLTFQYFFVYFGLWVGQTLREFLKVDTTLLKQTLDCCKGTINFCPMLAILFVGCRMRALLITNNRGAPPGWAQDGMYMATWAILLQFLTCLIVPIAFGSGREVDKDGTLVWEPKHPVLLWVAWGLKWITFLFLYGGVIAVIVAVYNMTPETANGRGSVPLVGDGKVPFIDEKVPLYDGVKEPYGPNDVPGMPKQSGPRVDAGSPAL